MVTILLTSKDVFPTLHNIKGEFFLKLCAPLGSYTVTGESKHQPDVSGETGLLDSNISNGYGN
jgi:hypothetical protein